MKRMVPISKGDDPTEFVNYRPVSFLPVLSQAFERVLRLSLVAFLDAIRVVIPGQYRLRTGHSMTMVVLDMVEKLRGGLGKGKDGTWPEKKLNYLFLQFNRKHR